jgi:hypothetical protein
MTSKIRMQRISVLLALALVVQGGRLDAASNPDIASTLRPPSVPLVACDPYFSIWSPADKLTDANTVHWTGKPHRLSSMVRIDGEAFRLMGKEPSALPALPQTGLEVLPTSTVNTFQGKGLRLTMTFLTAALPEDLMIYSRPVTYVTWEAMASDGKEHEVSIYFDASAEITVNEKTQQVRYAKKSIGKLSVLEMGSVDQPVLARKGDDLRIDWGHLYVAAPELVSAFHAVVPRGALDATFSTRGASADFNVLTPASANADLLVAALSYKPFKVSSKPAARWLILAYDDEYSIQYFKQNLRPYWRRNGDDAMALLKKAAADYESLKKRCAAFDKQLMASLTKAGGAQYAKICALAYIQCCAANKVVADANGQPLMFPKENFSNGCIGTVDVIYPMAPQFLLFSPSLTKAMLVPILDYAASPRWRWPFAPHDLGTYPLANGQVYGGGERTEENQMPVEETGNILVLLAALAQVEGHADFCANYWPVLDKWADYLKAKGFDPENQLCTDDFAGHLAHNVNLSAKAICGLGAYAKLCAMHGDKAKAEEIMKLARTFAVRWVKEADDGDHFRLAFDKPGTWSQKYNLVWDRILGLDLFPAEAVRKDMEFYKSKQNQYGLPLDSRKNYTKLDWTLWTATLTQDRADFETLVSPVYRFLNETPSRVPMTDWFDTKSGKMTGFQARSVVGGVFLQMLYEQPVWKEWASRDKTKSAKWAAFPKPPKIVTVVPTSEDAPYKWRYTLQPPGDGWYKADFDASTWNEGPGGFGTKETPGAVARTEWKTSDIWLRREFELPEPSVSNRTGVSPNSHPRWQDLQLRIHHDEDAEVYINGILGAKTTGFVTSYETVPIRTKAQATLNPGKQVIAVHCHQTTGGQFIDVGLVDVRAEAGEPKLK